MNRFLITISAVLITLSGFSVTATKEYVDRQDAETLQAAKDYADQHCGGGGGGVDTNAVRDIAREEITPATNRLNQTLSDALAAKRDKSDRAVYSGTRTENTDWTWESENKELEAALNDATAKPTYDSENHLWVITGTTHWGKFYYNSPGVYDVDALSVRLAFITIPDYVDYYATATRPRYMDEALGPAKPNQQLAAVATDDAAKPADGSLMKYDAANDRFVKATAGTDYADEAKGTNRQVVRGLVFDETKWNISVASSEYAREAEHAREAGSVMWSFVEAKPTTLSGYGITDGATKTELAAKRDLTNNVCRKTEFTEWICNPPRTEFGGVYSIRYDSPVKVYTLFDNQYAVEEIGSPTDDKLNLEFVGYCTATRSAVCTSNELFVTQSYVTNAVSEAKYVPSATDPTFSNAVLAVGIDTNTVAQIGELKQFFDGLPTGTVGTSLGGIILALLGAAAYLKKKTALLESDGKPTDQFATDLLGKQVANVKANTVSLAASYSETETYAVGDAVTHDGKLYKCAVAITTAEAWTPAHWTETTVATLWNNADTTSYGGQN